MCKSGVFFLFAKFTYSRNTHALDLSPSEYNRADGCGRGRGRRISAATMAREEEEEKEEEERGTEENNIS